MNELLKGLRHIFIPHIHNEYKPHFFREFSVLAITLVAFVLLTISAGSTLYIKNNNMTATVLPAVLVDLANDARTLNNEQILTRNKTLDAVAKLKAEDMARNVYFAHTSPSGATPWSWFDKAGYKFKYAGENLAIDFTESIDVENAWLASPTHKANILGSHFTEIGIATVDGIYQGHPTTYVVQMFGSPAAPSKTAFQDIAVKTTTVKNTKVITSKVAEPTVVVLAPKVQGESIVADQNLETITDTKDFIAVKNVLADETQVMSPPENATHSSWSERFLFMIPTYTDTIYKVFIWVVLIALLLMTIIEIRRQHKKNILYALILLIIMFSFVYINKAMFMTSFFA